jgi:ABC-2 type transport system permease protein
MPLACETPTSIGRFVLAYLRTNLAAALEYRLAFAAQVVGMLISDFMWLGFWVVFFHRFDLSDTWTIRQQCTLWAVGAAGFGLSTAVFGNQGRLGDLIVRGRLDAYAALPKPVLLHALVARMEPTAWGDLLFSLTVLALFVQPDGVGWAAFAIAVVASAAVKLAVNVVWQSLAFWLGPVDGLATMAYTAVLHFSTHPPVLFRGAVLVLLYTLLPAGLISWLPVAFVLEPRLDWIVLEVLSASLALLIAVGVFRRGMRRYQSSGLMTAGS